MTATTRLRHLWFAPVLFILGACGSHHAPSETQATGNASVPSTLAGQPAPFVTPNCSSASGADAAATGSSADVRGIQVGMSLDDAVLHLECLDPSKSVAQETNSNTIGVNYYGHQVRTHVNIAVGTPRTAQELAQSNGGYYSSGEAGTAAGFIYHWGLKHVDASYGLLAFGNSGAERVYGVEQKQEFDAGNQPTVANLESSLIAKYGEPSKRDQMNFTQILVWIHDPSSGQLVGQGNPLVNICALENSAIDGGGKSICGLTVVAAISPDNQNPLLATNFRVGLVDQGSFVRNVMQLTTAWQAENQIKQQNQAAKAAKVKAKL